jgi:RNA methyltransferase, TrmH family
VITSVRNPRVAAALKLHKRAFRERERAFLVEGAQVLGEAIGSGRGLSALFHGEPSGARPGPAQTRST